MTRRIYRTFEWLRWGEVWESTWGGVRYRSLWIYGAVSLVRDDLWLGPEGQTLGTEASSTLDRAVSKIRSDLRHQHHRAKLRPKLWGK